ncbi:Poglut2 [Symbiodinium sp. CCMP2456]|nr:Poglut2 [Symbiodinium sp. CCMP2456]
MEPRDSFSALQLHCIASARTNLAELAAAFPGRGQLDTLLSVRDDEMFLKVCCDRHQEDAKGMPFLCWPEFGAGPCGGYWQCCFSKLRVYLHEPAGVESILAPWMRRRLDQDFGMYESQMATRPRLPSLNSTLNAELCRVWMPGPAGDTGLCPQRPAPRYRGVCNDRWVSTLDTVLKVILWNVPATSWPEQGFSFELQSLRNLPPKAGLPDNLGTVHPAPLWPEGLLRRMHDFPGLSFPPIFCFSALPFVREGVVLIPSEILGSDKQLASLARTNELRFEKPYTSSKPSLLWRGSIGDPQSLEDHTAFLLRSHNLTDPQAREALKAAVHRACQIEMRGKYVAMSMDFPDILDCKFSCGRHRTLEVWPRLAELLGSLGLLVDRMPLKDFLDFRFGAILDGWSFARNTVLTLALDLTPFRVETYLQWWYHEGLQPWEHYVPLKSDVSVADVRDKVRWATAETAVAERIARSSTAFAMRWFPEPMQMAYVAAALMRYSRTFSTGGAVSGLEEIFRSKALR